MDSHRFDRMTRLIGQRALSRRQTLGLTASGVVAGITGGGGRTLAAQETEATPEAQASAGKRFYMFVQSFQSGGIALKEETEDTYTLTLEGGYGQTIYFADRPSREVGIVPTDQFLNGLGFPDDNPPNAAIVIDNGNGESDIVVVELFSPVTDDSSGVTFDIQVLANWQESIDVGLAEAPTDLASIAPEFGAAHLFIDDCADQAITCCVGYLTEFGFECSDVYGTLGPMGYCWHLGDFCCHPCESEDQNYWQAKCNAAFSGCNGSCEAVSGSCW